MIPARAHSGGRPTHPWDEWFSGGTWELKQGEDFASKVQGFATLARLAALKRNADVAVLVRGDRVYITRKGAPAGE